ncbi:SRPBCC family protein [Hymenobacter sp. ASUV-10]|uniref:SRPBCC family protein n=2 Tax=Hymenobacter aranciens TaxID=3063996 RepID=A0ABT9BCA0_9BACT|nr:SRPBCC family protein [Hymenobacter sp. ASUV-10]
MSTFIAAPPAACYALALNTQAHAESAKQTGERVLAAPPGGQLQLGDVVTWEGRHFGLRQHLTVRITAATPPTHFRDEQVRGAFRWLRHDHYFEAVAGGTHMRDVFDFQSPVGFVGRWFEQLFLTRYLTDFLRQRNAVLKQMLEAEISVSGLES